MESIRQTQKKYGSRTMMVAIIGMLAGFFCMNLMSMYMVATIRYVQEPPGIDCDRVIALTENLADKAFIEYKEQGSVDYLDMGININPIVSRTGYYVGFCTQQLVDLEKDPST